MSAISLKSISGITSITTPAGVDNQLTLHNNNTTEAVKLDTAGNLHFHNHLNITGVSTASNFKTGTSNLHNTGLNVQDLDVDGHTNLDNVNIAAVTTFSSNTIVTDGSNYSITQGSSGVFAIAASEPRIRLIDNESNPNYSIYNTSGVFRIHDETSNVNRLTISSSGNVSITNDLDVDGHTNLDNVNIAGITTFSNATTIVNGGYHRGIINSGAQAKIIGGYISGSDTLRLGESMYLTSTGLGIGVASPSRKLDVSGDILGNAFMLKGNTSASPSIQAQMYRPENNTLAFATNGNQERLRIKSDGKVLITNTLGLGGATSSPGDLLHAQSPSGEGKIVIIGATTGTVAISGLNGTSRVLFGDSSTENAGNITYTHSDDSLSFRVNGNTRWKFNSSGHFIPDSAGTYNIGNTSKEIGDVYIADDKKVFLGSAQDFTLHHNNAHAIKKNTTGSILDKVARKYLKQIKYHRIF